MLTASLFLLTLAVPALPGDGDVLAAAKDHVSRGRLGDASILLSQALESGSGDERALRLALADVHTKMGRAEEAMLTLEGLDPTDADVALTLGRARLAQADAMASQGFGQEELDLALGRARDHLEVALESSGGTGPAVWDLGQFLLYRDGQLDAALELADGTLADHPDDGEALLLRGAAGAYLYWSASQADPPQVDAANEAWNKAVGDLEKANELLPRERLEPLGQLVWFYEAQDISGKAVDTAKAIAERQPEPDYGLLFRLARKYRDNGRLEASGKALATMVSMSARDLTNFIRDSEDPDRVASDLSGAIFPYYQRGDKATCRQVLAAIVAAEPQDAGVWDNYAVLCQETSRYDDAVSAYEQRLKIDDSDPRTYNDLGAIYQYFLQRDMDKAKDLYDQCIDLADRQLAMIDAAPALKQNAAEAKRIAQDNLNQLRPGSSGTQGKGLLDSMVSGLRSLNLPKVGDNAEGDGEGEEDGDTEADTEGEGTGTEG